MRRVYIPNVTGQDISSAREYGELVVMTEGVQDKSNLSAHYLLFSQFLKDSHPLDKIAVVGPNTMVALAAAVFGSMHNRLNLLVFRSFRSGDRYTERTAVFTEKDILIPSK